jgi:hypothetical protein
MANAKKAALAAAAADNRESPDEDSEDSEDLFSEKVPGLQDAAYFASLGDASLPAAEPSVAAGAISLWSAELSKEPPAETVKAVSGGDVHAAGGAAAGVVAISENTQDASLPAAEPSVAAGAISLWSAELSKEPPAETVKAVSGGDVHAAGGAAAGVVAISEDAHSSYPAPEPSIAAVAAGAAAAGAAAAALSTKPSAEAVTAVSAAPGDLPGDALGDASISMAECFNSAHLGLQPLGGQPLGCAPPLKWFNEPSEETRKLEKDHEGVLETLHKNLNGEELSLLRLGSGGLALLSCASKAAASSIKPQVIVGAVVTTVGGVNWRVSM